MIKINHEMPLSLMLDKRFNSLTDYAYCLVHLLDEQPEYSKFFKNELSQGRQVLLDNSVFELEKPFDPNKFVEKINELKPTWYVVPDFLDDCGATTYSMKKWIERYLPKVTSNSLIIGSIQGKTVSDLTECYKYMSKNPHVAKIAITYNSKAYEELIQHKNPLMTFCEGRKEFISKLVDEKIWNNNKPHHLLGCSFSREFSYPLYHQISIESLDTSNPVICGIKGIRYHERFGNYEKPSVKLCTLIDSNLSDTQKDLVEFNIKAFRKIVNG